MTNKEALEVLEDLQRLLTHYRHISTELVEANGRAIEALEKQIPKKPDEYYDGYADGYPVIEFKCPNCGAELEADFDHHCRCGQSIDWSEVEE